MELPKTYFNEKISDPQTPLLPAVSLGAAYGIPMAILYQLARGRNVGWKDALIGAGIGAGSALIANTVNRKYFADEWDRYREGKKMQELGFQKTAKDMPSFTSQDRPEKVKEIYRALKREHPEWSAGKKARIAESTYNKMAAVSPKALRHALDKRITTTNELILNGNVPLTKQLLKRNISQGSNLIQKMTAEKAPASEGANAIRTTALAPAQLQDKLNYVNYFVNRSKEALNELKIIPYIKKTK